MKVSMIGKFVIVRANEAGVHAGTLIEVDGATALLSNARRLWEWRANKGIALSGVAKYGISHKDSKVDSEVPCVMVIGACEIIEASKESEESIRTAPGL